MRHFYKSFLLFLAFSFFVADAEAQYDCKENQVWAFGSRAGLDFNGGAPVAISTAIRDVPLLEGCASVSDAEGSLLFYSSADSIWNKYGQVMPNGSGLMRFDFQGNSTICRGWSSSQGSLIVPVPDMPRQYFVFSMQQSEYNTGWDSVAAGRLFYSIVDMSLGTAGDVVAGKKSIQADSMLSEQMIAVADNNCGIWLLLHEKKNHVFKAYKILATGLSANPVISTVGSLAGVFPYHYGNMKISPDRSKLLYCSTTIDSLGRGLELYDFDASSGQVSNCRLIDQYSNCYSGAFSPDNSKIYVTGAKGLQQYDVSLPTASAIKNSAIQIDPLVSTLTDIKLGPDAKIYFATGINATSLNSIDSPDNAGLSCHYVQNSVALLPGSKASYGMPNEYVKPICDVAVQNITVGENKWVIYPNPNNGNFKVSGTFETEERVVIEVVNIMGAIVYKEKIEKLKGNAQIHLNVPPGVYFLRSGKTSVGRLIVE